MLRLFRVSGVSMLPNFTDGQLLVTARLPRRLLHRGQVVVVRVAGEGFIVKRIGEIVGENRLRLASDNPTTTSVYCQRTVQINSVMGRVIFAFTPRLPRKNRA